MPDTRRDFLKKAALLTGGVSLHPLLPQRIQRALAIDPAAGSTWLDAEHVVILMQENRSFDHALGTLRGVRGYNDPRAIQLPNGNPVWLQSNTEGGTYAPFRLDIRNTRATWMDSLPHSWSNQVLARNDGRYDQWLNVKRNSIKEYSNMPLTLGYHTREDLPFYYALADAFTVCDQNFCSSLTGTNPNRLYFWTGTVREEQHEGSRAHVYNDDMDYGTLKWKTFPERLQALGIPWKCYQNEVAIDTGFEGEEDRWLSNFQDNPLEFFAQYNIRLYPRHIDAMKAKKPGHVPNQTLHDLPKEAQDLHRRAFDSNAGDPQFRSLEELLYEDKGIHRTMKAPKGDVLHQFREDVRSGKLPMVSWLSAPENFSDHPSAPWYGAWYVSEVLDILTQNPEVWKKTVFILAYDENDGYFDHVPPFTAPDPHRPGKGKVSEGIDTRVDFITKEQARERKGFPERFERECSIGLGFRVPLIIASPWSRGGWVNSQVFDHTSTLQLLEKFLSHKTGREVREPNISDWRRLVCGDLSSVFRPYFGERIAEPTSVPRELFLESINSAQYRKLPDTFKALTPAEIALFKQEPRNSPYATRQEPGTRPSCALPYCMLVDGRLNADRRSFGIRFENSNLAFGGRTAGAPFNVYAPGEYAAADNPGHFEALRTWAYAVRPGDTLSDKWPLADFQGGRYHLRVYGPNGFYREFGGDANDPALEIVFAYRPLMERGQVFDEVGVLAWKNSGKACMLELIDHSYGSVYPGRSLAAGEKNSMEIPLAASHGWYDFSVRVHGHPAFGIRYAGHIETGMDSVSDPAMA
ncbi:MAG TPA: phospholipase C, phosphocholine-specific [Puia sp.]|jgi:phospholipase C|nr:phospholipase C, phosphocholine-specific [Puia sp.]